MIQPTLQDLFVLNKILGMCLFRASNFLFLENGQEFKEFDV